MGAADREIELTSSRRVTQRIACGLLAATAAIAMFGMLSGSVQRPGPEGPLTCAGKGDFPLFCGHERIMEWHSTMATGSGVPSVLFVASALVLAVRGARGGRRGLVAGGVAMVIAVIAGITFNSVMWGDFLSFRGTASCVVADLSLVAMFFLGAGVLILTVVLEGAERRHLESLLPSLPQARVRR